MTPYHPTTVISVSKNTPQIPVLIIAKDSLVKVYFPMTIKPSAHVISPCLYLLLAVANSFIILSWGEDANSPAHFMHFGYPVGAMAAGLIASAFVSGNTTGNGTDVLHSELDTFETWEDFEQEEVTNASDFPDGSRIEIGFLIASLFYAVVAVLCIVLQFTNKGSKSATKRAYSWREICHPGEWASGNTGFALVILLLAVALQIALSGADEGIMYYLTQYAADSDLGFTKQEAATLNSSRF